MTMRMALHPRGHGEAVCVKTRRQRRITKIEDSVDTLIKRLEGYIKRTKEG